MKTFPQARIRNVSLVAHVDHGKTTLTDALLRRAGLLPADGAIGTFTDRLAVEKDRGITVKAQTCSVILRDTSDPASGGGDGGGEVEYLLNLIDTPGHVDFQYEVSRSLGASEAAALLVDVAQGVEAQTMAQYYAALEHDLTILPVLTKLDNVLNDAQVDRTLQQLEDSTGLLRREVVLTAAKTKCGMEALFRAMIDRVPPPRGREGFSDWCQLPVMHPESEERKAADAALVPLRALLFDCWTVESSGAVEQTLTHTAMHSAVSSSSSPGATSSTSVAAATAPTSASSSVSGTSGGRGKGIYGLIRVMDGTVTPGTVVTFFHSRTRYEVAGVGLIHPTLYPTAALTAGMVGYVYFPDLQKKDVLIGETLCTVPAKRFALASPDDIRQPQRSGGGGEPLENANVSDEAGVNALGRSDEPDGKRTSASAASVSASRLLIFPIPGFKTVRPVVFAGFFPDEGDILPQLREAVDLLCLNDPSVTVEPLQCQALGSGLQLGFLGLLHMQVFKERLLGEFGQSVLVTPPQVQYMCVDRGVDDVSDPANRKPITVNTWRWPHEGVATYLEPFVHATVVTPKDYFNPINSAAIAQFRGEQEDMRGIDDARMLVRYRMPLADLARGFFSVVKSRSHGYATLEYDEATYVEADLVKVDIVINKSKVSALSLICPRHESVAHGRRIIATLKAHLDRSIVDLPLQAMIAGKVVARDTIKAYRKDVTAKIHAGDISRKQKKWNDQKKGKERLARRMVGTVALDQEVLAAAMGASSLR